jgi:glucuronate isomerase
MAKAFLHARRKAESMVGMPVFLDEDFLLSTATARRLYHGHAESQPIVDYHTHLSAAAIAADHRFRDLTEIWLEDDHYKWRAMRACGIPERLCTGDAPAYEKFLAWARTVPDTLRNPLYHWTHLELKRYFGISGLLNPGTASSIWERAHEVLEGGLSAREILRKFCVRLVCTTDDPVDELSSHLAIAQTMSANAHGSEPVRVLPTFRPDKALRIDEPETFLPWLEKLREVSNIDIRDLPTLLDALRKRHDHFNEHGCRSSDHGLTRCYAKICDEGTAAKVFNKALSGQSTTPDDLESYASFLMLFFGRLDAEKGWVKQLHLGASRNLSTRAFEKPGPDTGFDAIGDQSQGAALANYLDLLQREAALPRMILYNANPADSYLFATIAVSFQASHNGSGALQYGPAWWFLDQKDGIIEQLSALSSVGLLSRFIGMTTDSRSFMSFPRHEYFRRILCDLIGEEVERGELPDDDKLLGERIEDICGRTALSYFGLSSDSLAPGQTSKNRVIRSV